MSDGDRVEFWDSDVPFHPTETRTETTTTERMSGREHGSDSPTEIPPSSISLAGRKPGVFFTTLHGNVTCSVGTLVDDLSPHEKRPRTLRTGVGSTGVK